MTQIALGNHPGAGPGPFRDALITFLLLGSCLAVGVFMGWDLGRRDARDRSDAAFAKLLPLDGFAIRRQEGGPAVALSKDGVIGVGNDPAAALADWLAAAGRGGPVLGEADSP